MTNSEQTTGSATRASHEVSAALITADLHQEIEALKVEMVASGQQHTAKTLSKDGELRVVLMRSLAGHRLREHAAQGSVMIQTLEGHLCTVASDQTWELPAGSVVMLEPGMRHDLEAREDTAFLLVIAQAP